MDLPENLDQEKLAEAALAILCLSSWDEEWGARAWKGMDWDLLGILHHKGWIGDPVGKKKSVHITEQGLTLATTFQEKYFGKKSALDPGLLAGQADLTPEPSKHPV